MVGERRSRPRRAYVSGDMRVEGSQRLTKHQARVAFRYLSSTGRPAGTYSAAANYGGQSIIIRDADNHVLAKVGCWARSNLDQVLS